MVSRVELTDQEVSTIVTLYEPIPIQTANGEVELKEKCEIFVRDLKLKVWAHILPDTVAVLSLGLLVEELCFPTFGILENAQSFAEATSQRDAILRTMFPLFILVLLLKLIAFLEQRGETHRSNRNQLAPTKINQKDLLR